MMLRSAAAARLLLFAAAAACGLWLWRLDFARKISTNVLDLVPSAERSPQLAAVRDLADNVQARVVLLTVSDAGERAAGALAAGRALSSELQRAPEFAEVRVLGDDRSIEDLGRHLFAARADLLLPAWLAREERAYAAEPAPRPHYPDWVAERAASQLENYLARPEALPLQELMPADPLLLLAPLLDHSRALAIPSGGSQGTALIWARLQVSPLSEAGQAPVAAAIERGIAAAQKAAPGASVRWTGIGRFASASRVHIEREIKWLNAASLAAVLAVATLFVRQVWRLVHLLPVVICSLLGAWTASTMIFPRVHILVLAVGALLTGVSIDYGFYIFMQPYLSAAETYGEKLRRLLKPLLASCLTTVAGFSLLMFSDLPLIRQIGLFVAAGLVAALAAAMLYFAGLQRPYLVPRGSGGASPAPRPWLRRVGQVAALAAGVIGLCAPWNLTWRDDVRELDMPQPALQANDAAVRAAFGDSAARKAYLTHGRDAADARRNLEAWLAELNQRFPQADPFSLALILPTQADYDATPRRLSALDGFPVSFTAALSRHGFTPEAFAPFFEFWRRATGTGARRPYAAVASELEGWLSGPLRLLASTDGSGRTWFVSLVDGSPPADPSANTIAAGELQHLNGLFTSYRWSALRLSLVGLALVIGSVFAIYPWRRAARIALIPAGSCFFVFGLLSLLGQTLNLFHLLGAFLGVCLAHNYSIFSTDTSERREPPPQPVRLSGLCAAASFGVLATSSIPVAHALGLTVSLIVVVALLVVEAERWIRVPPPA